MWSNLIGGGTAAGQSYDDDAQDGWEDDEDLVDDSESSSHNNNPPSPQQQQAANGGGGMRKMFVGRLTRFLEHVTQPDDEEEEEDDYEEEFVDADEDPNGWQDDEVLFEEQEQDKQPPVAEDKKVEDYAAPNTSFHVADISTGDDSHNAWNEDSALDDVGLLDDEDDDNFNTMRESINNVEATLNEALEDLHRQEADNASSSDNDMKEDDMQERKAVLEIQREMERVNPRPVVDVTPASGQHHWARSAATSIITQWNTEDGTRDSGPIGKGDDDEDIFQDENEEAFGPVVDQVPRKPVPFRRTDSLAVQANQEEEDVDDEAFDETIITTDEDHLGPPVEMTRGLDNQPAVVDHTPSVAFSRKSHGESVDAILSIAGETTLVNGEDEDSPQDYGPVVDQIPENATRAAPISGSVFPVMADDDLSQEFKNDEAMDETVFAKGDASTLDENTVEDQNGWNDDDDVDVDDVDIADKSTDDDGVDVNESADTAKISSILPEQGNMVDYTPYQDDDRPGTTDPSIVVLAADEDLTRDTGEPTDDEVFGEENELDFAPVVDHTPVDESSQQLTSGMSLQVEVSALEEDFRQDDAMDETCFGDSTVDPSNVGDVPDGWEEDDLKTPAVPNPNLVDQTPSQWESPPPKNADPSVAVLASIDESVNEEASEYGLVVDHTPRTPALPAASRSDSVIVQAADMETVEDESINDDDDDDGDTFTDELPGGIGAIRSAAENILVDRVPARPESRFGDASTMVAADPSEILSEPDDLMAQEEEQNFGPVVDVTPPSQAVMGRSSGAGSTAAFAPNSVATDDLEEDDGDETEANEAWNNTILEEATPNPQSGNDEPLQQQEQLVDFLPEEDASSLPAEDVSVMGRTASSSVAIGGAQSLLQPEDPKEDDFGPVVDQLPAPLSNIAASAASIATNVTASELRSLEKEDNIEARSVDFDLDEEKSKVVVDYVPHIREKQIMDSLATVAQSQLTEEEEEEEETASKFGPVVDHLPTPRTSVAPSRGGSTVDALATVSEADSAGNGGNGWDDDLDMEDASVDSDQTDRISTRGSVRRARSTTSDHDRSVSVRFDSTVRSASLKPPPMPAARYLLGASQNSSTTDGWEDDDIATDAADASSIATGEASRLFDHSIANAETPPSTPYNRPLVSATITDLSLLQPSMKECPSCANAKSMECPCVQKLLRITRGAGSLTGTLLTAEGDALEVDFGEMLREEIAKRRLLEEEAEALRTLSTNQQRASEKFAANETSLQSDLTNLRRENDNLLQQIEQLKKEGDQLRESSRIVSEDLKRSQTLSNELNKAKLELLQRESARLAEISGLKNLLDEKSEMLSAEQGVGTRLVSAEKQLLEKESECKQLEATIESLRSDVEKAEADARQASSQFESQVALYEEKLTHANEELSKNQRDLAEMSREFERAKRDAEMNADASKNEIDNLRAAKEMSEKHLSELRAQHQSESDRQYELLDSRTKELRTLEGKLKTSEDTKNMLSTELQKQRSINDSSARLSDALNSVTNERDVLLKAVAEKDEKVNALQSLVDEQGMQREALDSKRETELSDARADLKTAQDRLRSKEKQIDELKERVREAENEKEAALADTEAAQSSVWDMQEQLDTSNALLADAESKVDGLEAQLRDTEAHSMHTQRTFEAAKSEKHHLESKVTGLEKKLEMVTDDANRQAARANELDRKLNDAREELQRIRNEKDSLASRHQTLDERFQSMQSQMSIQLQEQHRQADQAIQERENELQRLRQEIRSFSQQSAVQKSIELELNNTREWIDLLTKEKESLVNENDELLVQLGSWKRQTDEAESGIEDLRREMEAVLLAVDAVNNGGDYDPNTSEITDSTRAVIDALFGLQTRYADLEAEMASYASDRESGLEKRIQDLEEACHAKDREIQDLRESASAADADTRQGIDDLQQTLRSLEHAIKEKDHVIQAKGFELSEAKSRLTSLEEQLNFARSSQSDANGAAHELRMTTTRAENAENELQHSQMELTQTKLLVQELQSQLSAHETSLEEMHAAQESSRQSALSWQRHSQALEEEVTRKSDRIADLEKSVGSLERARSTAPRESMSTTELDSLREQVASLTTTLQATLDRLTSKEAESQAMAAQILALQEQQKQPNSLGFDGIGGDDVESLRSHIVSLATALNQAETRRAETMELLQKERLENAESLRRTGASVRRFVSEMKNFA